MSTPKNEKAQILNEWLNNANRQLNETLETVRNQSRRYVGFERWLKEVFPVELLDVEVADCNIWSSYQMDGVTFDFPYNLAHYQPFKAILEQAGWQLKHENDPGRSSWASSKDFTWAHPDWKDYTITFQLRIQAKGSTCVKVPIKKEWKEVTTDYEIVCPEAHPDLFQHNEDGSFATDSNGGFIYIGDGLFPVVKDPRPDAEG